MEVEKKCAWCGKVTDNYPDMDIAFHDPYCERQYKLNQQKCNFKVGQELYVGADISAVIYYINETQIHALNWDGQDKIFYKEKLERFLKSPNIARIYDSISVGMWEVHRKAMKKYELIMVTSGQKQHVPLTYSITNPDMIRLFEDQIEELAKFVDQLDEICTYEQMQVMEETLKSRDFVLAFTEMFNTKMQRMKVWEQNMKRTEIK